jgi:hypothetical protein
LTKLAALHGLNGNPVAFLRYDARHCARRISLNAGHFIRLPGGFDRYEGRQSNGLFGEPRGVGSARRRALGCVSTV